MLGVGSYAAKALACIKLAEDCEKLAEDRRRVLRFHVQRQHPKLNGEQVEYQLAKDCASDEAYKGYVADNKWYISQAQMYALGAIISTVEPTYKVAAQRAGLD